MSANPWEWFLGLFTEKEPDYVSELPKILAWPISPKRGVRQIDAAGDGSFGASRDGGARKHLGLDMIAHEGDSIIAPCECELTHIGFAYAGSTLGSIHLKGWDDWGAYTFKLLYCHPKGTVGDILKRGEIVATCQDVSAYYHNKGVDGMTNHVHFEVHTQKGPINPLSLLESP